LSTAVVAAAVVTVVDGALPTSRQLISMNIGNDNKLFMRSSYLVVALVLDEVTGL
jgi:hypothetical protein